MVEWWKKIWKFSVRVADFETETRTQHLLNMYQVLFILQPHEASNTPTSSVSKRVRMVFLKGMLEGSEYQGWVGGQRSTISLSSHPLTWQQQSQLNSVAARFLDFFTSLLFSFFHSPDLGMAECGIFELLDHRGPIEGGLQYILAYTHTHTRV
jgi:hypothetical protein